ncbi:sulfur carrier protein ThiS [Nocardioides sp. AE5]|uniref:sulfur carrier protein ThiS n=1 Tax=Nocardioides sp. AE5 TaxID=2962573 RepID=UPI0028818C45|nr:sulfur carrier protein ThiS [Nocardioides sp. AE5]MDT0202214.1 sulfur carrier protein ThiS [Nocardioides sp. AE5]
MQINLNGEPYRLEAGATVADLAVDQGSAVAVNGAVVPRGDHPARLLADGDMVEIVTAVQGG